ncbi:hypothetical protein BU14_2971s0001 [Porphyra umbilicalis]|uniref:Symplekin C-terminal domain-containing protein n=1 Tax=Porphyra umbilicalis TaxID=2786 RepID=A0A1X6NIH7_PORUM|nr:hypothetical protein BU14_2971s0001 [Porphyra umbilicalis]|eukprot:OSX68340.1 hypothetical protein BU14_2971s0001 [Porphyra umbilicalis]
MPVLSGLNRREVLRLLPVLVAHPPGAALAAQAAADDAWSAGVAAAAAAATAGGAAAPSFVPVMEKLLSRRPAPVLSPSELLVEIHRLPTAGEDGGDGVTAAGVAGGIAVGAASGLPVPVSSGGGGGGGGRGGGGGGGGGRSGRGGGASGGRGGAAALPVGGVPLAALKAATSAAFELPAHYTRQTLAVVAQQLVEVTPPPPLFLPSLLQTVAAHPALSTFVATNILARLVDKEVWAHGAAWAGFVAACEATLPASAPVLLKLPPAQLGGALRASEALRGPLKAHAAAARGGVLSWQRNIIDGA